MKMTPVAHARDQLGIVEDGPARAIRHTAYMIDMQMRHRHEGHLPRRDCGLRQRLPERAPILAVSLRAAGINQHHRAPAAYHEGVDRNIHGLGVKGDPSLRRGPRDILDSRRQSRETGAVAPASDPPLTR